MHVYYGDDILGPVLFYVLSLTWTYIACMLCKLLVHWYCLILHHLGTFTSAARGYKMRFLFRGMESLQETAVTAATTPSKPELLWRRSTSFATALCFIAMSISRSFRLCSRC